MPSPEDRDEQEPATAGGDDQEQADTLSLEEKKRLAAEAVRTATATTIPPIEATAGYWGGSPLGSRYGYSLAYGMSEEEIDDALAEASAERKRRQAKYRLRYWVSLGVAGFGVLLTAVAVLFQAAAPVWMSPGVVIAISGGLFAGIAFVLEQSFLANIQAELDVLAARKKSLSRLKTAAPQGTGDQSTDSYFDSLVRINVDNLGAYYALVKVHTDKSFRVSLLVGVVGFMLIVAGLAFGFFTDTSNLILTYIATASGVVVEFISGVFFYLYNRTVRQMKGYHDSLLTVQNVLLSFKLVGDTKDEQAKTKMVGQMLAYLVGKHPLPSGADGLLHDEGAQNP